MTEDQAVAAIERSELTFHTLVHGHRAEVVVVCATLLGSKHLTTHPDDFKANNLLYLPECP